MEHLKALFNVVVTAEYITFIAAIFLLYKKQTGIWRFFIPLLFLIVCVETYGWYARYFLNKSNALVFNLNMVVTVSFMLWVLSTAAISQKIRRFIFGLGGIFLSIAAFNLLFLQGFFQYNYYSESIGDIIEVIVCCILLYYLITQEPYINILGYEYFWLANGILFSAMGSAVLYTFPTLLANFQKHSGINIFVILNNILNILLYGSLIIAFICRNRNTKLSRAL
ncbi:MAG: hypothetical protein JSS98_18435 [Bacteroidetes bacterium]|nr:hypothetical protein [Bacteroidota bacterium]MBS1738565.1 hypothetical protein [Bacteroidota bacterium]